MRAFFSAVKRPVLLAIVPQEQPAGRLRSALVFFVDIGWEGANSRFVARAYDLSRTEQEILEKFILGQSLEDIAQARCRSYNTVRTQFYSALGKCGLSSQVDLIREVVAGSMFQSLAAPAIEAARPQHCRALRLLRPGGRTLDVVASGDFSGRPILMLAGIGVQNVSPKKMAKFHAAGICLFAVSPPGLGHTDPAPEGTERLDCLADDVRFVLDQLGVKSAPFACFGTNLLMTMRLARRLPQQVSRIQSWITIPPARFRPEGVKGRPLNPVSSMAAALSISPALKDLVTRSGLRAWSLLGTRKMVKMHYRSEPETTEHLLSDPDALDAIDAGVKSAIRQGFHKDLLADAEAIHSDWFEDAQACPAPLEIVHGTQDKTNSIESVREFAQALEGRAHVTEVEDGGGFLHLTHEDLHVAFLRQIAQGAG